MFSFRRVALLPVCSEYRGIFRRCLVFYFSRRCFGLPLLPGSRVCEKCDGEAENADVFIRKVREGPGARMSRTTEVTFAENESSIMPAFETSVQV